MSQARAFLRPFLPCSKKNIYNQILYILQNDFFHLELILTKMVPHLLNLFFFKKQQHVHQHLMFFFFSKKSSLTVFENNPTQTFLLCFKSQVGDVKIPSRAEEDLEEEPCPPEEPSGWGGGQGRFAKAASPVSPQNPLGKVPGGSKQKGAFFPAKKRGEGKMGFLDEVGWFWYFFFKKSPVQKMGW